MTRALLGTAPAGATNAVRWQDLLAQNTATMPTNGWYLPSANTLGVATNGVQRGLIGSNGGWQVGTPTGGDKGSGNINVAGGYYVNGVALSNASGANPSASIGLSAVNGTATTYLRSDGAPALSQAITPVWTGNHYYAPTSGIAVTINGVSGAQVMTLASGSSGTTAFQDLAITRASTTVNTINTGPNLQLTDNGAITGSELQHSGGQTELWQYNGGWNQILKVLSTRGVTINAPASGNALTVSGALSVTGTTALQAVTATNISISSSFGQSWLQLGSSTYAWYGYAMDIGAAGGIYGAFSDGLALVDNLYYNYSTYWTYKNAGSSYGGAAFNISGGAFSWNTAPLSGAAGSAATLTSRMALSNTGTLTVSGGVGINGASAPAQVTGWGTPTGAAVTNNFSGTAATTAQIQSAVAKIITDLKAFGLYGA